MTGVEQQRRLVTVVFSDLSNSTGIAAGLEPEHYAELLGQLRSIVTQIIPAHGGEVIRFDGDGVLCVFGHPLPFDDAGRRATEAALDLHAAMTALDATFALPDQPLQLHTGVHAGMVLVRNGDLVRGKYEILGDATNIAARLCDAAAPGEILVSTETLGSDREFFVTKQARPVMISGHRAKVEVWPVSGRADIPNRFVARTRKGLTPFAGRSVEQAAYRDWLNAPTPRVLKVHGPPGIGKSRFAGEGAAFARESGWTVARGYCEAYLSAQPLQPFLHVMSSLEGGQTSQALVPGTFAARIVQSANVAPLLLILDDWQWADDASRDMLGEIRALPHSLRLKVLLLSREAELDDLLADDEADLLLPPLTRDEALSTIDELLQRPDPFVIDRIKQAAGGSPLLIEELCHAFAADTATPAADPRGAWFDLSVQARFAKLDDAEASLLQTAAVIGHFLPEWLLQAVDPAASEPALLDRLQSSDFLFPGDTPETLRFKHGLTRDAIYASIGMADRKQLHGRVLDALEAKALVHGKAALLDAIAYHSAAADMPGKALPYGIEAGDAALASGALDRAQGHYSACFDIAEGLPSDQKKRDMIWTLINKYGLSCIVDPAPDQLAMLERASSALAQFGNPRDQMRSAYWLGSITYGIGSGKSSVGHLQTALTIAEVSGSSRDQELIRTKLAQSLFTSGDYARAALHFQHLLPRLRSATSRNDRELSAYALSCFGFEHSDQGDFSAASALFEEAETILDDPGNAMNASILLYRAAALASQGEWERVIEVSETVLRVSQRSRTRLQNSTSRAQAAFARWQLSRDPDAVIALERAASLLLVPGVSQQRASMVFGWMVQVMAETRDRPKARRYMGDVIKRIRLAGDRVGEALAWRALARLAQDEGDPALADRYLRFAQHSASVRQSRREVAHNQMCEADLARDRGRDDIADPLLNQASRAFAEMRMPYFRDRALNLTSR